MSVKNAARPHVTGISRYHIAVYHCSQHHAILYARRIVLKRSRYNDEVRTNKGEIWWDEERVASRRLQWWNTSEFSGTACFIARLQYSVDICTFHLPRWIYVALWSNTQVPDTFQNLCSDTKLITMSSVRGVSHMTYS
jgi:hypothetical protein